MKFTANQKKIVEILKTENKSMTCLELAERMGKKVAGISQIIGGVNAFLETHFVKYTPGRKNASEDTYEYLERGELK